MPNEEAAIWSAAAALFAAVSSFLIMRIQRRNLIETTRPVLILDGWTRRVEGEGDASREVIGVKSIRNVGKGLGLQLYFRVFETVELESFEPYCVLRHTESAPTAVMPTIAMPVLAVNESAEIPADITVWWKNVRSPSAGGQKMLQFKVRVECFDTRGARHLTLYRLVMLENEDPIGGISMVAPGLGILSRTSSWTPAWQLACARRLVKVPLLGSLFRDSLR